MKFNQVKTLEAGYHLMLDISRKDTGLTLHLTSKNKFFTPEKSITFLNHIVNFGLNISNSSPQLLVSTVPYCLPEEIKLLRNYNDVQKRNYFVQTSIVDELETSINSSNELAKRTALIFRQSKISFGEMQRYTDSVSNYLSSFLSSKEMIVGILMPRGYHFVLAAISVLFKKQLSL